MLVQEKIRYRQKIRQGDRYSSFINQLLMRELWHHVIYSDSGISIWIESQLSFLLGGLGQVVSHLPPALSQCYGLTNSHKGCRAELALSLMNLIVTCQLLDFNTRMLALGKKDQDVQSNHFILQLSRLEEMPMSKFYYQRTKVQGRAPR